MDVIVKPRTAQFAIYVCILPPFIVIVSVVVMDLYRKIKFNRKTLLVLHSVND